MSVNGAYHRTEEEFGAEPPRAGAAATREHRARAHSYEEAISLAGTGGYTRGLLACLSLTILSMGADMFGFSVVVAGASCDLRVSAEQRSLLMSMPFAGAIVMSYPWGYFSDTRGRRRCLLLAMAGGCAASTLGAFSPHWAVLAVLKFISTSCCSCAQSVTYALLGESSPARARGGYMLTMTAVLMLTPAFYFAVGYYVLSLEFSLQLGPLRLAPWRLLALLLALPMALSAAGLAACHESPKFLASRGREPEALDLLRSIWARNGGKGDYPVKRLVAAEEGAPRAAGGGLLRALRRQTAPLLRPPLLLRTLQLYYLTAVVYSTNNSFVMWYPFISDAFLSGVGAARAGAAGGLCNMIHGAQNVSSVDPAACSGALEPLTALSSVGHSASFAVVNLAMSRGAARMRLMLLALLAVAGACSVAVVFTTNNFASFLLFLGVTCTGLGIGIIFSYFIKLYPTSYRGMVACLGVMVARSSALAGINVLGAHFIDNCYQCFYGVSAYIFSGLVVAVFLPPDRPKKTG